MKRKTAMALSPPRAVAKAMPEGELIMVLAAGEAHLPRRRRANGPAAIERFVAILGNLVDSDTAVAKLNVTKALEARSPATLRAMTCNLEGYAAFAGTLAGAGLPA